MIKTTAKVASILVLIGSAAHAPAGEPSPGPANAAEAAMEAVLDDLKSGWSFEDYSPLLSYQPTPAALYFAARSVPLSAGVLSKGGKQAVIDALAAACRKKGGEHRVDQGYAGWRNAGMERFFKALQVSGLGEVQNLVGDDVAEVACNQDGRMLAQARLVRVGKRFAPLEVGIYDIRVIDVSGMDLAGERRDAALMAGALLGNRLAGDELQRIALERQKAEAERQRRAEAAANEELRQATESLRGGLKRGDDTNSGLVIEVKAPIAQVQTTAGVQWMRIDALYPSGVRCDFNSSGYQKRTFGF